jgi:phosphosulfolactate synthase (CoM biosynthesis protein A)
MNSLSSALRLNPREPKPRSRGLTEVRGPYYSVVGTRYLSDVLDTMGEYVDSLKFAGGSFCLMPDTRVRELVEVCHAHAVLVSTGGFLERALPLGAEAVNRCLTICRSLGFDTIEVSAGFVSVPSEDLLTLARRALDLGFRVKPEVGIQFGAGGGSSVDQLQTEAPREADQAIRMAEAYLELGIPVVMVESEGLTEGVTTPRSEVIARVAASLGLDHLMFEAADLRAGLWGTADVWGRISTYKPPSTDHS